MVDLPYDAIHVANGKGALRLRIGDKTGENRCDLFNDLR